MTKQFTVITKDGSKWLRPVLNPSDTDQLSRFFQNAGDGFEDLPYIGSRPEGTVLSEEQVKPRKQVLYNGEWQQFKRPIPNGNYETRIAYTDAEPECPECGKYCSCPEEDIYDAVADYRKNHPEQSHDRHISDDYPGIDYQPLFSHMSKNHGLTLTTSEMDEIIGLSTYILAKK